MPALSYFLLFTKIFIQNQQTNFQNLFVIMNLFKYTEELNESSLCTTVC